MTTPAHGVTRRRRARALRPLRGGSRVASSPRLARQDSSGGVAVPEAETVAMEAISREDLARPRLIPVIGGDRGDAATRAVPIQDRGDTPNRDGSPDRDDTPTDPQPVVSLDEWRGESTAAWSEGAVQSDMPSDTRAVPAPDATVATPIALETNDTRAIDAWADVRPPIDRTVDPIDRTMPPRVHPRAPSVIRALREAAGEAEPAREMPAPALERPPPRGPARRRSRLPLAAFLLAAGVAFLFAWIIQALL